MNNLNNLIFPRWKSTIITGVSPIQISDKQINDFIYYLFYLWFQYINDDIRQQIIANAFNFTTLFKTKKIMAKHCVSKNITICIMY